MSEFTELTWSVKFDYDASLKKMVSDLDAVGKEHKVKVDIDVDTRKLGEIKKANEAFKNLNKAAKQKDSTLKQLRATLKQYKEELADAHKEVREGGGATQENIERQRMLGQSIQEVSQQIREANRGFIEGSEAVKGKAVTVADLKAQYSALMSERERIPVDSEEFQNLSKRADGVNKKLKELDATVGIHSRKVGDYANEIRAAANAIAVFQGPLGPVAGRLNAFATVVGRLVVMSSNASQGMGVFGRTILGTIPRITTSAKAFTAKGAAVRVANASIMALNATLRLLRAAIIATGIGALVVAIGAVVQSFRRTEEGAQRLRVIMAGLGAGFDVIKDILADFGDVIISAFTDPQQAVRDLWSVIKTNLLNRVKGVSDFYVSLFRMMRSGLRGVGAAVRGIFDKDAREDAKKFFEEALDEAKKTADAFVQSVTGVEDPISKAADAAKGLKNQLQDAVEEGEFLQEEMNKVLVVERELGVRRARQNRDLQRARDLARELTIPQEERLRLLNDIRESELSLMQEELANERKRLSIMQARADMSKTDEATKQELADQQQKVFDLERAHLERSMSMRRDETAVLRQLREVELRNARRVLDARIRTDEATLARTERRFNEEGRMLEHALKRQSMFEDRFNEEISQRRGVFRQELINQGLLDERAFQQARADLEESQQIELQSRLADARTQKLEEGADREEHIANVRAEIEADHQRTMLALKERAANDAEQFRLADQRAEEEMAIERQRLEDQVDEARLARAQTMREFEFEQEALHRDRMLAQELFDLEQRGDKLGALRRQEQEMEFRQEHERQFHLERIAEEFRNRGIEAEVAANMARVQLDQEYAAEREEMERKLASATRENNRDMMNAIVDLNSAGLSAIFKDNKTAAVASSVVETLTGVNRAFMENNPPSPQAFVAAATTMAIGVANIRRILRSGEKSTTVGGSTGTAPPPPRESFGLVDVGSVSSPFADQMASSAGAVGSTQQLPPIIIEGDLDPAYLALKVTQGNNQISSDATGF